MLWCADCCNKRVWKRKKIYKWESRFIKGKKVEIMKVFSVVLLILSVFSCRASDPGKRHVSPAGIAPVFCGRAGPFTELRYAGEHGGGAFGYDVYALPDDEIVADNGAVFYDDRAYFGKERDSRRF